MPKAYIVASINVTDPDGFKEYLNAAVKIRGRRPAASCW